MRASISSISRNHKNYIQIGEAAAFPHILIMVPGSIQLFLNADVNESWLQLCTLACSFAATRIEAPSANAEER